MKKITSQKPYFDEKGNLYLPDDLKFGGEVKPPLKPNEWWFLLMTITNHSKISEKKYKEKFELFRSKSALYRIKKSLVKKGYLKNETKLY